MKGFKCQGCGGSSLAEIMQNCTVSSIVEDFGPDPKFVDELQYGETETTFGEVTHYQCDDCGLRLPNVTSPDELYFYIKGEETSD